MHQPISLLCCAGWALQALAAGIIPMFLAGGAVALWQADRMDKAARRFLHYQTGQRYKDFHK